MRIYNVIFYRCCRAVCVRRWNCSESLI